MEIFVELWVGSLIVAGILGVLTYYPCYYGICWYRMKRWGQLVPPSAAGEPREEPKTESDDRPNAEGEMVTASASGDSDRSP
jgi:hypothetical protein